MALRSVAEEYFSSLNPIAAKIHEDIQEAKSSYENIWDSLTEKQKYALLDTLDFDLNDPPVHKDDLMSFFGREHSQRIVQDEHGSYRDEYSAPFLFQTRSQLNLCILNEEIKAKAESMSPPPVMSELALSHSKVVNELKNALKSHDVLKSTFKEKDKEVVSPTSFISKFIGFKARDEERECLVPSAAQSQVVASSDNFFRTNYKSPSSDMKIEKDYRS
ncbi:unnamed protein product, partial [Leptidea sinapis]